MLITDFSSLSKPGKKQFPDMQRPYLQYRSCGWQLSTYTIKNLARITLLTG